MTSIIDPRSIDTRIPASMTIYIPALDTRGDWWDDYVSAVEEKSGLRWIGDDSQYGMFVDFIGNRYQAYVRPDLSDEDRWTVDLDLVD